MDIKKKLIMNLFKIPLNNIIKLLQEGNVYNNIVSVKTIGKTQRTNIELLIEQKIKQEKLYEIINKIIKYEIGKTDTKSWKLIFSTINNNTYFYISLEFLITKNKNYFNIIITDNIKDIIDDYDTESDSDSSINYDYTYNYKLSP